MTPFTRRDGPPDPGLQSGSFTTAQCQALCAARSDCQFINVQTKYWFGFDYANGGSATIPAGYCALVTGPCVVVQYEDGWVRIGFIEPRIYRFTGTRSPTAAPTAAPIMDPVALGSSLSFDGPDGRGGYWSACGYFPSCPDRNYYGDNTRQNRYGATSNFCPRDPTGGGANGYPHKLLCCLPLSAVPLNHRGPYNARCNPLPPATSSPNGGKGAISVVESATSQWGGTNWFQLPDDARSITFTTVGDASINVGLMAKADVAELSAATPDYVRRANGNCGGYGFIESEQECAAAAAALGLGDMWPTTSFDPPSIGQTLPHGCFFSLSLLSFSQTDPRALYFNANGDRDYGATDRLSLCHARPDGQAPMVVMVYPNNEEHVREYSQTSQTYTVQTFPGVDGVLGAGTYRLSICGNRVRVYKMVKLLGVFQVDQTLTAAAVLSTSTPYVIVGQIYHAGASITDVDYSSPSQCV